MHILKNLNITSSDRISGFRPDIEGLRAVAVIFVLLYHISSDVLPGGFVGVDIFFVISGFLITGLLVRELERDSRISLLNFYARRAKRLLPAAGIILVVAAAISLIFLPVIDRSVFGYDIIFSSVYLANWQFAARNVDYLAEDISPSPVQHFWSLAVEEQYYIVWPILLVLVGWIVRRRKLSIRPVMAACLLTIALPSFAWSVYETANNQSAAFFVTATRMWELAVGAFIAVGSFLWIRIPKTWAIVLGWLGVTAVLASGVIFNELSAWPGYLAILPTLGTAAIVVAGFSAGQSGASRLLSFLPMVWLGGLSYSVYLCHWPIIVAAKSYFGSLNVETALFVIALSILPAWLIHRFVENPIRYSQKLNRSPRLALIIGFSFTFIGMLAGSCLVFFEAERDHADNQLPANFGARSLPDNPAEGTIVISTNRAGQIIPNPKNATKDVPKAYSLNCQTELHSTELSDCEIGDENGTVDIVLTGDSKILQWYSAFDELGKKHGWKIRVITKSACPFADTLILYKSKTPYPECREWNKKALNYILSAKPDYVITSQRITKGAVSPEDPNTDYTSNAMVSSLARIWKKLEDNNIEVAVLLDNPAPDLKVYECVAENPDNLAVCSFDRKKGIKQSAVPVQLEAASVLKEADVIDLTDAICPAEQCPPVIGGVLIYRQGSHLTDTYIRSLTPRLEKALISIIK